MKEGTREVRKNWSNENKRCMRPSLTMCRHRLQMLFTSDTHAANTKCFLTNTDPADFLLLFSQVDRL